MAPATHPQMMSRGYADLTCFVSDTAMLLILALTVKLCEHLASKQSGQYLLKWYRYDKSWVWRTF